MAAAEGIDVSYANGQIQWSEVASAKDFAIIRAGYGQNNIDATADYNCSHANLYVLPIGLYWFSYAYTAAMAYDEGLYCGAFASLYNITLPLYWDFEYDSIDYAAQHGVTVDEALFHAMAAEFCRGVEDFGYTSGLYYNPDLRNRFNIEAFFTTHPNSKRWIAQWGQTEPSSYDMWQYTSGGTCPGIRGNVDLDKMASAPVPPLKQGKMPLWMYLKLP